jgi:hypothetical protein
LAGKIQILGGKPALNKFDMDCHGFNSDFAVRSPIYATGKWPKIVT